ncbi:uncharacterized protein LOC124539156 [Vanessa cardui]|uniref:uncharacterized protein LOC124539156 n=1 Tax=Vanessa cardui TaxID=171605 RepID=UPI001F12B5E9|nr:uncharacterized protein LOC124539156 [Vanessa cardui]
MTTTIFLTTNQAKILRNNALMTKMVSNFRKENDFSDEKEESHLILNKMQNVLCKNFPTIPCNMIQQDKALKKLIEKSIQQINYKKLSFEKTTPFPGYLTLFPIVSNDLSSQPAQDKVYFVKKDYRKDTHEKRKKIKTKTHTAVYNRKKLRKFYPHKVKYRDKTSRIKEDFAENSEEKLSMSVEVPDMTMTRKHQHFSYKMEPVDPPVWRIDYMKHGEPSVNMFGQEDGFHGFMKTGPNVIVDGRPAAGMFVELYKKKDNGWTLWHNTVTSSDGRIQFPFSKESMAEGTYKLKFNVEDHYTRSNQETLYPYVEIVFKTKEDEHYHIPLLLSPYGYSTYRGS